MTSASLHKFISKKLHLLQKFSIKNHLMFPFVHFLSALPSTFLHNFFWLISFLDCLINDILIHSPFANRINVGSCSSFVPLKTIFPRKLVKKGLRNHNFLETSKKKWFLLGYQEESLHQYKKRGPIRRMCHRYAWGGYTLT